MILASYPKSGNTWVRLLLGRLWAPSRPWSLALALECPALKIHAVCSAVPPACPVVYLVRDPRDVALSMAAFFDCAQAEAAALLEGAALADGQRLGSWQEHVESWTQRTPCLVVSYEHLSESPAATLATIAAHLGVPATPAQCEAAVGEATFARCQAAEAVDGFAEASPHAPFFRVGRVGAWRTELVPALAARIADSQRRAMWFCGYEG